MSLLKVHDNWPEWVIKWLEKMVDKGGGKYTLTIEKSAEEPFGEMLGSAFAKERDKQFLGLLN